jgi:hypothetical protein
LTSASVYRALVLFVNIYIFGERGLVEISERGGRFEVGIRKVNLLVS